MSRYNPLAMPDVSLPYGDSVLQAMLPERTRFVGGGRNGGPRLTPVADQAAAVREGARQAARIAACRQPRTAGGTRADRVRRPDGALVRPHPRARHRGGARGAARGRGAGGERDAHLRERPPPQVDARGALAHPLTRARRALRRPPALPRRRGPGRHREPRDDAFWATTSISIGWSSSRT